VALIRLKIGNAAPTSPRRKSEIIFYLHFVCVSRAAGVPLEECEAYSPMGPRQVIFPAFARIGVHDPRSVLVECRNVENRFLGALAFAALLLIPHQFF
jgi:hypothetical protein